MVKEMTEKPKTLNEAFRKIEDLQENVRILKIRNNQIVATVDHLEETVKAFKRLTETFMGEITDAVHAKAEDQDVKIQEIKTLTEETSRNVRSDAW